MRRVLIVTCAVLALAGCGRKDAQQQAQQQQQNSPFVQDNAPQQQQQSSGGGLFSSSCPALPSRDAVAKSIKDALTAIYGADETGAKVSVVSITPSGDCKTVAVAYKSSGTPANATMSHDGDKWSLTFYNKQYRVQ